MEKTGTQKGQQQQPQSQQQQGQQNGQPWQGNNPAASQQRAQPPHHIQQGAKGGMAVAAFDDTLQGFLTKLSAALTAASEAWNRANTKKTPPEIDLSKEARMLDGASQAIDTFLAGLQTDEHADNQDIPAPTVPEVVA